MIGRNKSQHQKKWLPGDKGQRQHGNGWKQIVIINLFVVNGNMATREKTRVLRTPSMVRSANGHAVNKWCGSCAHKEIQAGSSAEGRRWCTKLAQEVDIDDICPEWELDEKLAKL